MSDRGGTIEADVHASEDVSEGVPETRKRQLTEKGLEYTQQVKRKRLEQLCRSLERHMNMCIDMMDDDREIDEVHGQYYKWSKLYEELLTIDQEYSQLLPATDRDEYNDDWFSPRNAVFQEFTDSVDRWTKTKNTEQSSTQIARGTARVHVDIVEDDDMSVLSGKSGKSAASRRSVLSARIQQEQQKVELKIRASSLKKKQGLAETKLRLQLQEEEIQLEEEIAVNDAQSQILDKIDTQSVSHSSHHSRSQTSDFCDPGVLSSLVKRLNKPKSDIKVFGGNPLEYQRFLRQFRTQILANCENDDEKSEPNRIIQGYSYLNATHGYKLAMDELNERYGDPDIIVDAYVKRAINWSQIKPDNVKGIDEFAIFITECEQAVKDIDSLKILEYAENFKRIVGKLPFNLQEKWRNVVQNRRDSGKKPVFHDLVVFVRREAKKGMDPTFGRDAMKDGTTLSCVQSSNRPRGSFASAVSSENKPASLQTAAPMRSATANTNKPNPFEAPCMYCKQSHPLNKCDSITALPFAQRSQFIKDKGCCFGCLRFGHHRKDCRNKSICKVCQMRHPSIPHINRKPNPNTESTSVNNSS